MLCELLGGQGEEDAAGGDGESKTFSLARLLEHTLCLQQLYSYLAQYSVFVNNLGAHTMLGTVIIFYRFTLFQPLYTCTQTNLRVTYSGQIRGRSESTLILTNESQPRLIRVDQSQGSKLSKTHKPQTSRLYDKALPCEKRFCLRNLRAKLETLHLILA